MTEPLGDNDTGRLVRAHARRAFGPGFADRVMSRIDEDATGLVLLPQFLGLAAAAATVTLLLIGYSVLWTEPLEGQSFIEAVLGLEPVSIESAYGLDDKLPYIDGDNSL